MIIKEPQYDIIRPDPESFLQSARSFGYNIETAIADIIDNNDEEPANHDTLYAEIDKEDVLEVEKKHTKHLLSILIQSGETKAKAIEEILRIEPFVKHKEELLNFLKQ
jgi:hypothetical protein